MGTHFTGSKICYSTFLKLISFCLVGGFGDREEGYILLVNNFLYFAKFGKNTGNGVSRSSVLVGV